MWNLYANITKGSSPIKTANGWEYSQTIHISSAKTFGRENVEINSLEDFERIAKSKPLINHVMFYFGQPFPRKGCDTEKAIKWVKRLLKEKEMINSKNAN